MTLGNIVSKGRVEVSEEFNVVGSLDEIIQGIPTLIIGWDYVKRNYANYDIYDKKLDNDLYWTFKKTEKRDLHDEDLIDFIKETYNSLVEKVTYHYIDVIHHDYETLLNTIRRLYTLKETTTYFYGEMVYIYGDSIIFGVDLKLFRYIGLNISKIRDKIKQKSTHFLVGDEILIEYKKHLEFLDGNVKFIPYLYSINHE